MNPLDRIGAAANRLAQLADHREQHVRTVAHDAASAIRAALREIGQAVEDAAKRQAVVAAEPGLDELGALFFQRRPKRRATHF